MAARPQHGREAHSPGMLAVMKAVLWSFLGIRRRDDYNRDAVSLKPYQVIIAGVIAAVLLVATLVLIVRFVVSQ